MEHRGVNGDGQGDRPVAPVGDVPESTPETPAAVTPTEIDFDVPGRRTLIVADPDGFARELAALGGAEIVTDEDALAAAIERRAGALADLERCRAAVEVKERLEAREPVAATVLIDTDGLRQLAADVSAARQLVPASVNRVREHVGMALAGADLAVHPETIRRAATDVLASRRRVAQITADLAEIDSAIEEEEDRLNPPDPWAGEPEIEGAEAFSPEEHVDDQRRLDATRALSSSQIFAVVGVSVLLATILVVAGTPPIIALPLPLIALLFVARRRREGKEELASDDLARQNLAAVGSLADRAYGGEASRMERAEQAGAGFVVDSVLDDARAEKSAMLAAAEGDLREAEGHWRSLLGESADPEDLDAVLSLRDPQRKLAPELIHQTPTVRAAERHRRRLEARWRVAWDVLDRPAPDPDQAEDAIAALEAEEVYLVTVEPWSPPLVDGDERDELEARYRELLGDDSPEDVERTVARGLQPLIVVGDEDVVDRARRETDVIADEVAILVVTASEATVS